MPYLISILVLLFGAVLGAQSKKPSLTAEEKSIADEMHGCGKSPMSSGRR